MSFIQPTTLEISVDRTQQLDPTSLSLNGTKTPFISDVADTLDALTEALTDPSVENNWIYFERKREATYEMVDNEVLKGECMLETELRDPRSVATKLTAGAIFHWFFEGEKGGVQESSPEWHQLSDHLTDLAEMLDEGILQEADIKNRLIHALFKFNRVHPAISIEVYETLVKMVAQMKATGHKPVTRECDDVQSDPPVGLTIAQI